MNNTCCIENCETKVLAKRMCARHYMQIRNFGEIRYTKPVGKTMYKTKRAYLYFTYRDMIARCYKQSSPDFKRYGARNIEVCERWRGNYGLEFFIEDMGDRPSSEYSLDRIDNDGNYEPSNCRWATRKQQANNRRKKVYSKIRNSHREYVVTRL